MALSSSLALRRILGGPSAALLQCKWPFSPNRYRSSSIPPDNGGTSGGDGNPPPPSIPKLFSSENDVLSGGGNLPPLTTSKLFVSGLSRLTTDDKLREAFSPYGQLHEARVITDRVSGRSKGFGFVQYSTIEEADKAREGMNAKFLDGWVIFVDPAKPREPRPPRAREPEPSETGFRTNKTIGWCG